MSELTLYRAKPEIVVVQEQENGQILVIGQDGKKRNLTAETFAEQYEPAETADVSQLLRRALPPGAADAAHRDGRRGRRKQKGVKRSGATGRRKRCSDCGKLCASARGLAIHRGQVHDTTGERRSNAGSGSGHRCPDCGKPFASPQGLGGHRAKVHGHRKGKRPRGRGVPADRTEIPMTTCPSCEKLTTLNPCENCHMKIPPAAVGKG